MTFKTELISFFFFIFFKFLCIYFERDGGGAGGEGAGRGRERGRETIPSRLPAASTESDAALELTNGEITT